VYDLGGRHIICYYILLGPQTPRLAWPREYSAKLASPNGVEKALLLVTTVVGSAARTAPTRIPSLSRMIARPSRTVQFPSQPGESLLTTFGNFTHRVIWYDCEMPSGKWRKKALRRMAPADPQVTSDNWWQERTW